MKPPNDVQVDEMFFEINMTQSNGLGVQVNQNVGAQLDEFLLEINMAQEHGSAEQVSQHVGELAPDLFWKKKIDRSLKGENQVLITSCIIYKKKKKYIMLCFFYKKTLWML